MAYLRVFIFTGIVFSGFAILSPKSSDSTTLLYMPTWELYDHSSNITIGTVQNVNSFWDKNKKFIYTRAEFSVDEILKGSTSNTVFHVLSPGGTVDNIQMKVHGAASFAPKERALLYLTKIKENTLQSKNMNQLDQYMVAGYTLGKFEIFSDTVSGQEMVRNNVEDIHFVNRVNGSTNQSHTPMLKTAAVKPRSLASLKNEIINLSNEN